jgi:hypothetical protein
MSRALPIHNPARCSVILWPDLGNMTVVISATEGEWACLLLGLLKQHNRLTRDTQLIKQLDSSEKGTQFRLRISVDLRGCVQSSRRKAARTLEPRVRVLLEK